MSFRNIATGFTGSNKSFPLKLSYSRHKPNGLDKNTVLEGSALESRKSAFSPKSSMKKDTISDTTTSKPAETDNWRTKYASLQRQVKSLRKELEMKEQVISQLKNQKLAQDESHEQELLKLNSLIQQRENMLKLNQEESGSKLSHFLQEKKKLESVVENLKAEMDSLKRFHAETLSRMCKKHGKELEELTNKFKLKINQMENSHADTIKQKDNTIENLKETVASSFNESSKERQNQIDELIKELKRVSDEAEYVKSALRKFKTSECSRCHMYQEKYKEVSLQLSEKEVICKDLYLVCSKMEKQLSQKHDLMEIWNAVKASK